MTARKSALLPADLKSVLDCFDGPERGASTDKTERFNISTHFDCALRSGSC